MVVKRGTAGGHIRVVPVPSDRSAVAAALLAVLAVGLPLLIGRLLFHQLTGLLGGLRPAAGPLAVLMLVFAVLLVLAGDRRGDRRLALVALGVAALFVLAVLASAAATGLAAVAAVAGILVTLASKRIPLAARGAWYPAPRAHHWLVLPIIFAALTVPLQPQAAQAVVGAGLTNVAGLPGDCEAPGQNTTCSVLFTAESTSMLPGDAPVVRTVRLGLTAPGLVAGVGFYVSRLESPAPGGGASCTAADPADGIGFSVEHGGTTLYSGTLAGLAATHGGPGAALPMPSDRDDQSYRWRSGDSATLTLRAWLPAATPLEYMGCRALADFTWIAQEIP